MRLLSVLLLLLLANPAFAQPADGTFDPAVADPASALARDVASLPGPVPDFAPMAGITVHSAAHDIASAFSGAIAGALGDRLSWSSFDYSGRGHSDPNYVWARDYNPIYVRMPDGSL